MISKRYLYNDSRPQVATRGITDRLDESARTEASFNFLSGRFSALKDNLLNAGNLRTAYIERVLLAQAIIIEGIGGRAPSSATSFEIGTAIYGDLHSAVSFSTLVSVPKETVSV